MARAQGSQTTAPSSTPVALKRKTLKRKAATIDSAMAAWWNLLSEHPECRVDCGRVYWALLDHATRTLPAFLSEALETRTRERFDAWTAAVETGEPVPCPEPIDLSEEAIKRCLRTQETTPTHLDAA